MRGGAHIGALRAIQEVQGSLEFPDGIYGSSVGSIVGSLIAFNIPFETINTVLRKHHKRSWWLPMPSVSHAFGMSERRGIFTMDQLREMILSIYKDCGMTDIEAKRICDAPQPLFIVASNLSTRRPAILTGEVPLVQAILCSCCIPGLFEPQVLYGDVYLDAAVYVRALELIVPPRTLVLRLYDKGKKIVPTSTFTEIFYACYAGIQPLRDDVHVCAFKDLKVGIIDDVTDKERDELFEQGYLQTLSFMAKMAAKEDK
jgi:hypothetical protein